MRTWIIIVIVIAGACAGIFYCFPVYHAEGSANAIQVIPDDFVEVRKCLVRTNALEEIVAINSGELLDHRWSTGNIQFDNSLKNWHLKLHGTYSVRCNHGSFKGTILDFEDEVEIQPLNIITESQSKPSGNLQLYRTSVQLFPCKQGGTQIIVQTGIDYQGRIPRWRQASAKQEVDDSANRGCQATMNGIVDHIRQNKGKIILNFGR